MIEPVVYERACLHGFAAARVCPVCLHFGKIRQAEYDAADDFARSYSECLAEIRARIANGGPGWGQ